MTSPKKVSHCYSREQTLILLIETLKEVIDKEKFVKPISSDMKKAFDCLHLLLLLAKLRAYGFDEERRLIQLYFTIRQSKVKLGEGTGTKSFWKHVTCKGCSQRSSVGHLLWNIFQNDLTYTIKSSVCMYADDHHFNEMNNYNNEVRSKLQESANVAYVCRIEFSSG